MKFILPNNNYTNTQYQQQQQHSKNNCGTGRISEKT